MHAPTACRQTGSGSVSLPCSGFFSPFPHGTGSLSVSREYLALRDGPRRFTQNSSCSALLRIPLGFGSQSCKGLSPATVSLSRLFHLTACLPRRGPTTPLLPKQQRFGLFRVRSPLLAESHFVFSSYGYLDVSVPRVRLLDRMTGLPPAGLPHSDIRGSRVICTSPRLFAAYHVLHRLREPRHPPSALAYFLLPSRPLQTVSGSIFLQLALLFLFFLVVQHVKDLSVFLLIAPDSNLKWRITDSNR